MTGSRLGIDVGGTKIAAVVLDQAGRARFRTRIDTPKNYDALIRAISDLVAQCNGNGEAVARVGIGMPGSQSPQTGIWRNCNMTFVNGRDFAPDLRSVVTQPVLIENDANYFA